MLNKYNCIDIMLNMNGLTFIPNIIKRLQLYAVYDRHKQVSPLTIYQNIHELWPYKMKNSSQQHLETT